MKANKKGISLIVLIITIVVIIILAAAIILNLSQTNLINNANDAVSKNDLGEVQSAVTLAYGDMYADYQLGKVEEAPTPASVAAKVAPTLPAKVGGICASTDDSMDDKDHYEIDTNYGVTFVPAVEAEPETPADGE